MSSSRVLQSPPGREKFWAGLEVVGFWHTHPDPPSRASRYDADHAWPGYVYVILSVMQGKAEGEQGWELETQDPAEFREEPLTA